MHGLSNSFRLTCDYHKSNFPDLLSGCSTQAAVRGIPNRKILNIFFNPYSFHNWLQWNFSIWSLCLLTLTKVNIDGEIQFSNVAILVLGQWILHNSKIFDHQLHHCRYLLLNKSSQRIESRKPSASRDKNCIPQNP